MEWKIYNRTPYGASVIAEASTIEKIVDLYAAFLFASVHTDIYIKQEESE